MASKYPPPLRVLAGFTVFHDPPCQICDSGSLSSVAPTAMHPLAAQHDTPASEPYVELLWLHDCPFQSSVSVLPAGPEPRLGWVPPTATQAAPDLHDTPLRSEGRPWFGVLWTVQEPVPAQAVPTDANMAQAKVASIRVTRRFHTPAAPAIFPSGRTVTLAYESVPSATNSDSYRKVWRRAHPPEDVAQAVNSDECRRAPAIGQYTEADRLSSCSRARSCCGLPGRGPGCRRLSWPDVVAWHRA